MDIFDRAAHMFDRAQGRMADATNQAARLVLSASQVRALEARRGELRQALETASMELGKLAYGRWKSPHLANDAAMQALCQQIDRLNAEYQRILGDLADARAAMPVTYPPRPVFAGAQYRPQGGPPYPQMTTRAGGVPYQQPGSPVSYGQQTGTIPPGDAAYPQQGSPAGHGQQAQPFSAAPLLYPPPVPQLPPRPPKPTRECPECYSMVPGSTDFCPSCGMRV